CYHPLLRPALHLIPVRLAGVNSYLHASVLRSSRIGVIRLNRLRLAFANRMKPSGWNTKRLEVRAGGLSSPLREVEVVGVRADAVSVADNQDIRVGVLLQAVGELREVFLHRRQDFRRVQREEDSRSTRHRDSLD